MAYIDETWYAGSDGHKLGLLLMWSVVTECAYLIPH